VTETSLAVNPEPMTLSFKVRRERVQEGEREREREKKAERAIGRLSPRRRRKERNEEAKPFSSFSFSLVHRPRSEAAPGSFRTLPSRPTTILSRD